MSYELNVRSAELVLHNDALHLLQGEPKALQSHYVDLYDGAPVGYCILSEKSLILQANRTAATLLGLPRGELAMQAIDHFILDEDRDTFSQHRHYLFATEKLQTCELHMVKADGTIFWVRLHSLLKQGNDGKLICRTTFSDITESKRVEEVVREQKDFFLRITENLSDFIAVLDLQGRRLYNSYSYEQHFGAPEKSATDSFDEIHPDDRERVRQAIREIARSGQGQQLEFRFLMPDGRIRDMESRCNLIMGKDPRNTRVVLISNDITERKQIQDHVRQMSLHDPLTQLPNRRLLSDRLGQAMACSVRTGSYGALMFIDLDDFKLINDEHGHDKGDLILTEAADRLRQSVREVDTVARFGGDEFVVLLSQLDEDKSKSLSQARLIAEKLRLSLSGPYQVASADAATGNTAIKHCCTASIGVTLLEPQDTTPGSILKRADIAMFKAKNEGGNQVRFNLAACW